jgi:hypothetical protein
VLAGVLGSILSVSPSRAEDAAAAAAANQEGIDFFEKHIRPVLAENCYECHSAAAASLKGGLRLDTAELLRKGGESGPAIVPGKPAESTLLSALKYESYEMPPKGKLPEAVAADFEMWIAMGAPDPRTGSESSAAAAAPKTNPRDIWSLKKPQKARAPEVHDGAWTRTVIDSFILAKLEEAGLKPSPDAAPRVLLRRLYYDLTGLPPSADELNRFEKRASNAEYEQAVDKLLASPRFGERWGRYWLDVARYSDTKGYVFNEDRNYPTAYKYRDWVIGAFNGDMPFDKFIVAQIAADQVAGAAPAAMGFLTLGRRFLNVQPDINDDRIDVICRGLMGMTVACARCHDHKFDAIPTADYYSLYGVLASSKETPHDDSPATLVDEPKPVEQHVFLRGNAGAMGPVVTRHFPACLSEGEPKPFQKGSGRLELAEAIASPDNPRTARVWVNRVWSKLFGRGLVTTPSDFGIRGDLPTHPELLDWLATTFMDDGWSTKRLVRRIVLSSAYRQSSAPRDDAHEKDAENKLLARMNRRRLDLEAMRDSLLAAAGRLDETMGGPSVQLTQQPFPTRRSVYGFVERQNLPAFFRTFDFANPNTPAAVRPQTASPHQALFLLNSPFAIEQSRHLAEKSGAAGSTPTAPTANERIARMYLFALGRAPTVEELAEATAFVSSGEAGDEAARIAALPRWQYGWGVYDPLSDRVDFHAFTQFVANAWQGGPAIPDPTFRYAMLNVEGGHPGDASHQVIRRWTAPAAGTLHIEGELKHPEPHGNGVIARIVSSSRGRVGEWTAANSVSPTPVNAVQVSAGETIDFVVDSRGDDGYDTFTWRTTLRLQQADGVTKSWNSHDGIEGPKPPKPLPLGRWGQLAQVLLMSNEFMFVD